MKSIFALLLTLVFIPSFSQKSRVETLLDQIDSVYSHANTYRDHGEASYSFAGLFLPNKKVERFKTVFVRNCQFRFSYHTRFEPTSFYGFQWDSTGTIQGFSFMKSWTRTDGDYPSCVDGATGISMGASHTVPRLLMPATIGGKHFLRGTGEITWSAMDTLDGQVCHVLHNGSGIRPEMTIWVDEDSLLIRQITSAVHNSITRYYPEINRPIPAEDLIFNPRKENRAVLWRYAPREYFVLLVALIILLIFVIGKLIRGIQEKKGIQPEHLNTARFHKLRKATGQIVSAVIIASMFFNLISDPDAFLLIVLVVITLGLAMLGIQHLSFPDWVYRHHFLYLNLVFVLSCMGMTFWIFSKIPDGDLSGMTAWMIGMVPIMSIYLTFALLVHRRKWKRLRALTPCDGEQHDSLTASAGLMNSEEDEMNDTAEGRIVLFPDRIVFLAKDGSSTPILFNKVQKISVYREWRIVPAGLVLTDISNGVSYLEVEMPYFWKDKMKA